MPIVTQSVPVTEKVQDKCIHFNCGEYKITLESRNEHENQALKDHCTGAEENLFQRLKNKIVPIEPNEDFKCVK